MSFIIRNISIVLETLVYRGREGQWAYLVHRVAGLGVLLFLSLHIVDIFIIAFGPEVFNALLFIYKGPVARVLEVFLAFGLLFHALNGLRIIAQDFYPPLMRHHRTLFWIQAVIFSLLFIPAGTFMMAEFITVWGGLVFALALWVLVPLAAFAQYKIPAQLNLNVSEAGGAK